MYSYAAAVTAFLKAPLASVVERAKNDTSGVVFLTNKFNKKVMKVFIS